MTEFFKSNLLKIFKQFTEILDQNLLKVYKNFIYLKIFIENLVKFRAKLTLKFKFADDS